MRWPETAEQAHRRLRLHARAVIEGRAPWPAETDERRALHEAGHVVMASLVANMRIAAVTIEPGDVLSAHVAYADGSTGSRLGIAAVSWAGPIAEDSFLCATLDMQDIRDMSPQWLSSTAPDSPFELAHSVLRERWRQVRAVTAALMECRTLTGDQLGEILARMV